MELCGTFMELSFKKWKVYEYIGHRKTFLQTFMDGRAMNLTAAGIGRTWPFPLYSSSPGPF